MLRRYKTGLTRQSTTVTRELFENTSLSYATYMKTVLGSFNTIEHFTSLYFGCSRSEQRVSFGTSLVSVVTEVLEFVNLGVCSGVVV